MVTTKTLNRQISSSMVLVFAFVLISKLVGAAKELAVAWRYGISETVDAYLFVFNIAQWPIAIVGGVLSSVLIPLAIKLNAEHDTASLRPFRAEIFGVVGGLFAAIAILVALVLPMLLDQSWVGLSNSQAEIAVAMAPLISTTIFFAGVAQVFAIWVMILGRHINSLFEAIPSLVLLGFVLALQGEPALVWGTVAGSVLHMLLLFQYLLPKKVLTAPKLSMKSEHWGALLAGVGVMLVGHTLSTSTSLVDQFFAAHLGEGALSTIGYANRLLSLILSLGALVVSRSLLPILTKGFNENYSATNNVVHRWSAFLFASGVIVALLFMWWAPEILKLLFERGKFSADDTARVTLVFQYAAVQVPFYCVSMVAVYSLLSLGQYRYVAFIGFVNLVTKATLAYLLVKPLGIHGLVLSTSGVYFMSALVAFIFLYRLRSNPEA